MAAVGFTLNRAEVVDRNFVAFCKRAAESGGSAHSERPDNEPVYSNTPWLTCGMLRELFESQVVSRRLDLMARDLRKEGRGYYTIGSSGHEGNVVLGRFVRASDPSFLHYRSGALLAERFRQRPAESFVRETLVSFMASTLDPIAGGRHKVWGSVPLGVIPQTSTIASHLPRAMGAALALERAKRLGITPVMGDFGEIPNDSIVLCNFGDASANHSVAVGAINTCCNSAFRAWPIPLLWVCEDNGIGISVETPEGWIEANYRGRAGLTYFKCDGLDLIDAARGVREAVEFVRTTRRPAFLHMRTVRLLGHAGTDPETEYHTIREIEATEARDPLLASAQIMIDAGLFSAAEVLDLYDRVRDEIKREADALGTPPQLSTAAEVIAPLAPYSPDEVNTEASRTASQSERLATFAGEPPGFAKSSASDAPRLPENQPPRHLAALLNWALRDLLAKYPELHIFGEDVGTRGGVYYVTAGLQKMLGPERIFNTLLDETSILGMAIGAGHLGLLPMPEIQYLAYVHNAIDQLRGEACSTQFFSNGQFANPMVVRIQSLGYQKGFGGHFHNDNSFAALRDIPGLIVAVPCRGDDAARMLRTCVALAKVNGRVVCFLEPIALYMTKDLFEAGDGKWLCAYPAPDQTIQLGQGKIYYGDGSEAEGAALGETPQDDENDDDLTILTFGNGVHMSLRAAKTLRDQHGVSARVVDLRWMNPLNEAFILQEAAATGRVLVVDEGRHSGGVSEAILSIIAEHYLRPCGAGEDEHDEEKVIAARVVGHDTYIPLGPPANTVTPTEEDVIEAALRLVTVPQERSSQSSRASLKP